MKTIAVTVPLGFVVKEYLLSDFLPTLTSQARVVVLSPLADDPNFRSYFDSKNIVVEKMEVPELGRVSREMECLLTYAHFYRHQSVLGTNVMNFQSFRHKRSPWRSVLKSAVIRPCTRLAARTLFKHITIEQQVHIEQFFYLCLKEETKRLADVLQKYQIDLIFSSSSLLAYLEPERKPSR